MKGYPVPNGFKGYIPRSNTYILFDTEEEYVEYYREREREEESNAL